MKNLEPIADVIRGQFEEIDEAREKAYKLSRDVTRLCALTIRAIHREDWSEADALLAETRQAVNDLVRCTEPFPMIHWAGYTQDCLKEYVEAEHTYALIQDRPLKSPADLGVDGAAWLNGLAEASTELRRRLLDILRHDHDSEAERLIGIMDDVYSVLITFDFRDAITNNLRRRTDQVRAVLERTRGDLTTSLRQQKLEKALAGLEKKIQSSQP